MNLRLEIEKRLFFLIDDEKKRLELYNMIIKYAEKCKVETQLYLKSELQFENEKLKEKMLRLEKQLQYSNDFISKIREITCEECE